MTKPFTFIHFTGRVVFGWDAVAQLSDIVAQRGATRVVIVVDAYFRDQPLAGRLVEICRRPGAGTPALFDVDRHEPTTDMVERLRDQLAAVDPDLIVVVGGGSAMDATKVARALLANPGPTETIAGFGKSLAAHGSYLVCVPTTAGTGSEVSETSVISKANSDLKLIIRGQAIAAHVAILDPALTVSAPASVTAASGYDAMTHAVEAFVSNASNPMTDPIAEAAVASLARWLPIACAEPEHREARAACLIASAQGAIAFNTAALGLAHALSAPLGALFHVAHGLGNALALPYITAFNHPVLGEKGATLARHLDARTPAEGLAKLRHAIGLDLSLDAFVLDAAGREALAVAAMKSGQIKMNPRLADIDDMRAIIEAMRRPTGNAAPNFAR
jgi:alcohol dehydrogenase class IV